MAASVKKRSNTKSIQADIYMRPCFTLRSTLSTDNIMSKSEGCNSPSIYKLSYDKRLGQVESEFISSVKWRLSLKWKREQEHDVAPVFGESTNIVRLVPSVRAEPDSDIREKLGDVWIIPGYIRLDTELCDTRKMLTPSNPDNKIILQKCQSYQCDLTSMDEQAITVDLDECGSEIAVEVEIVVVKHSLSIIEPVKIPPCDILQTFGNLLAQNEEESREKYCDLTLTATQQSDSPDEKPSKVNFYAHKAILTARSPVFAKMLLHKMKESMTNIIELSDIEPPVMNELLIYIYTNECPNIRSHAAALLYYAEKYELNHLKALCECQLSYDLQIKNAAKTLLLADACSASQLKRNTLLFIGRHGSQVLATKDWDDVKKNAELLQDLLSTVFNVKKPSGCM